MINIDNSIKSAQLGRHRKDAQTDTCTVFAAALYDVLTELGVKCTMFCVLGNVPKPWAHEVVRVGDRYYDSMGEFSMEVYRMRAKIHPSVTFTLNFRKSFRKDCFDEEEYPGLHAFYVKHLKKVMVHK